MFSLGSHFLLLFDRLKSPFAIIKIAHFSTFALDAVTNFYLNERKALLAV